MTPGLPPAQHAMRLAGAAGLPAGRLGGMAAPGAAHWLDEALRDHALHQVSAALPQIPSVAVIDIDETSLRSWGHGHGRQHGRLWKSCSVITRCAPLAWMISLS